jgi:hypothetical protein
MHMHILASAHTANPRCSEASYECSTVSCLAMRVPGSCFVKRLSRAACSRSGVVGCQPCCCTVAGMPRHHRWQSVTRAWDRVGSAEWHTIRGSNRWQAVGAHHHSYSSGHHRGCRRQAAHNRSPSSLTQQATVVHATVCLKLHLAKSHNQYLEQLVTLTISASDRRTSFSKNKTTNLPNTGRRANHRTGMNKKP